MTADSNDIGKAVERWINELPSLEDGAQNRGILGDWLTIACMVTVDSGGHPRAEYYVSMRDGNLLPHVAEGLIERARSELADLWDGGDE